MAVHLLPTTPPCPWDRIAFLQAPLPAPGLCFPPVGPWMIEGKPALIPMLSHPEAGLWGSGSERWGPLETTVMSGIPLK